MQVENCVKSISVHELGMLFIFWINYENHNSLICIYIINL